MFFKKQAFKIKDLLKEQGIEIPLVTMQEMLAKSYGFNNRHVALAATNFHEQLEKIKQFSNLTKVESEELKNLQKNLKENTPIKEMPQILTRENISLYSFWWNYDSDEPVHYPTTSPGSPFDEDYLDLDSKNPELEFWICELRDDMMIYPTRIEYTYNREADHFERNDISVKNIISSASDKNSLLSTLPEVLDKSTIEGFSFYWRTEAAEQVHSHPGLSPLDFGTDFTILTPSLSTKKFELTFVKYIYDKNKQSFQKQNVIRTYLQSKGERTFFKQFKEVKVSEKDMIKLMESSSSWPEEIKRILNHRDCPISILEKYAQHESFFVRIVAIFSKTNREQMVDFAKKDKDVRVRGLYYKYLVDQTEMDLEEIRNLLKKEAPALVSMVRYTPVDGGILVNW